MSEQCGSLLKILVMRNPLLKFTLMSCSILFFDLNSAQAGELTRRDPCQSLGRVILSHDSGIMPGSELCKGGELTVGDRLKVFIGCFQGGGTRWLSAGRYNVNELCANQRTVESSCWFLLKIANCNRSINEIALTSPRSSVVSATPKLEWEVVNEATHYNIVVESDSGDFYSIRADSPKADLSIYKPWKAGNYYRINLTAFRDSVFLSEGKFTIRVSSKEEIEELKATINNIESSNFSIVDKVRLIDSEYMSRGLIYESIK